jgi:hypothetical protein
MSRRTRIIILLLFLTLGGIPLVYVAPSWSPKDPIRFQVVGFKKNLHRTARTEEEGMLEVTLENTSPYPIHIYNASLFRDEDRSSARDRFFGSDQDGLGSSNLGVISPGEKMHSSIPWTPVAAMPEEAGRLTGCFYWMSGTRSWVDTYGRWARSQSNGHLPEFLIPTMKSRYDEARVLPPSNAVAGSKL